MNDLAKARAAGDELEAMRAAKRQLAMGGTYLTTTEAVAECPIPITDDALLDYPEFILPRTPKNPHAKKLTYYFDARDLLELPAVLRRWGRAVRLGPDAERAFEAERQEELEARDRNALLPATEAA